MFNSELKSRISANVIESNTTPKIHINKEYEDLLPRMTKEAFVSLMDSIRESRQLVPITINNKCEVLDGHNRLKVCKKLGLEPIYEVKTFDNPLYEKLYIDINSQRRQLTTAQRIQLNLKKKPVLQELARKNSQINLRRGNIKTEYPSDMQICTLPKLKNMYIYQSLTVSDYHTI